MAQRRKHKVDAADAELIEQVLASRGWQLITERHEKTLMATIQDLERQHTEVETATIRGTIAGLRLAAKLPEILIGEAREGKRDGTN